MVLLGPRTLGGVTRAVYACLIFATFPQVQAPSRAVGHSHVGTMEVDRPPGLHGALSCVFPRSDRDVNSVGRRHAQGPRRCPTRQRPRTLLGPPAARPQAGASGMEVRDPSAGLGRKKSPVPAGGGVQVGPLQVSVCNLPRTAVVSQSTGTCPGRPAFLRCRGKATALVQPGLCRVEALHQLAITH